jgi:hypothetical protein
MGVGLGVWCFVDAGWNTPCCERIALAVALEHGINTSQSPVSKMTKVEKISEKIYGDILKR